jgi:hypothetical protein
MSGRDSWCIVAGTYVLFIYSAKACLTILESADHALFKMVRYVLLRPLRPELDAKTKTTRFCHLDEQAMRQYRRFFEPIDTVSTDMMKRVLCCSSARQNHAFDRRHCGLARHFKTDPTETVALCFGYAKTPC